MIGPKADASAIALDINAKCITGEFTWDDAGVHPRERAKAPKTFRQYAESWFTDYVTRTLKPSTAEGYRKILNGRLYPVFGDKRLDHIGRDDIKELIDDMLGGNLTPARCKRVKAVMSGVYHAAMEDGVVAHNPAAKLDRYLPAEKREIPNAWSADELRSYLDHMKDMRREYFTFFLLLARTGMRAGEALALRPQDIDGSSRVIHVTRAWSSGQITLPKTHRTRQVPMTPALHQTLADHLRDMIARFGKPPELLFCTSTGAPYGLPNLHTRVHGPVCEAAKVRRIRIHDLRHTYATIRIRAGHNIKDVSMALGHASIKMTLDTYYHWLAPADDSASELDNM